MQPVIRVSRDNEYQYTVQPVDDDRRFKAAADCNTHGRRDRASDTAVRACRLPDAAGLVNAWLSECIPSATLVAERRADAVNPRAYRGSNEGRQPAWADTVLGGAAISMKLRQDGEKHKYILASTVSVTSIDAQLSDLAANGGRLLACVVLADTYEDKYAIDHAHMRWAVIDIAAALRGQTGASLLGSARGRGRPPKGAILPNVWGLWRDTDCREGSIDVCIRVPDEIRTGTIEDLHASLRA
jgi:hypothetical protein